MRPSHVPAELVVDLDVFLDEPIPQMLEKFEKWRAISPIVWTDHNNGHWVALSAQAVEQVLSDFKNFSSAEPRRGTTLTVVERPLQVPIEMDGAEHRQYRRVLMPLFSPLRVQMLETAVRSKARTLIDEMVARGGGDVVADFARPVSGEMFMGLMDWPLEDRHILEDLADLGLNGPQGVSPEERAAAKLSSHMQIAEYVKGQIARRRAAPEGDPGDITTVIMNTKLDGDVPIPEDKLIGMLRLLLFAGLDTTQSVLSQSLAYLAQHPEAQEHLRTHRDDIPRSVEEFLRSATVALPARTARVDCEVGGVRIQKGDTVLGVIPAANRDPSKFEDPATVDPDRDNNRHITFSVGPHKCIGSALARVVLAAALDEFHQAIPAYHLESVETHLGAVWGLNELKIVLDPAPQLV